MLKSLVFLLFFMSCSAFSGTLLGRYQVASTCATPDVSEPEKQNCRNCWQTRGRPVWSARNCRWEQGPCTGEKPRSPLCSGGREYVGRFNNNSCTWERASGSTCRRRSSDDDGYGSGGGATTVVSCTENHHCGTGKICSPQKVCVCREGSVLKSSTNTCVECTSDRHCSEGQECNAENICEAPSNTSCTTENADDKCGSTQICTGGVCTACEEGKVAKRSNNSCFQCHSANKSKCTGDTPSCHNNRCVECKPDALSECEANEICTNNACEACPNNQTRSQSGNTCEASSGTSCTAATAARVCTGNTPYCHNNNCVECKIIDGQPALGHTACRNRDSSKPRCVNNECVADSSGTICTPENKARVCTGNTPYCHNNNCVECKLIDGQSALGHTACRNRDPSKPRCVNNRCVAASSGAGCTPENAARVCTGNTPYCHNNNCVECKLIDGQSALGHTACRNRDPSKPRCVNNRCVAAPAASGDVCSASTIGERCDRSSNRVLTSGNWNNQCIKRGNNYPCVNVSCLSGQQYVSDTRRNETPEDRLFCEGTNLKHERCLFYDFGLRKQNRECPATPSTGPVLIEGNSNRCNEPAIQYNTCVRTCMECQGDCLLARSGRLMNGAASCSNDDTDACVSRRNTCLTNAYNAAQNAGRTGDRPSNGYCNVFCKELHPAGFERRREGIHTPCTTDASCRTNGGCRVCNQETRICEDPTAVICRGGGRYDSSTCSCVCPSDKVLQDGNKCVECYGGDTSKCTGNTPYCHNNNCVKCKIIGNQPALGDPACRARDSSKPRCFEPMNDGVKQYPRCVQCKVGTVSEDCASNQICNSSGTCVDCSSGQVRGGTNNNTCVAAPSADPCSGQNKVTHPTTGICVPCYGPKENPNGDGDRTKCIGRDSGPYCHGNQCVQCKYGMANHPCIDGGTCNSDNTCTSASQGVTEE